MRRRARTVADTTCPMIRWDNTPQSCSFPPGTSKVRGVNPAASVPAAAENAPVADERRKRRSNDPLIALHHHLAETRRRTAATAVVLADMQGVVVAGAGAWPVCEELAAYAPLVAHGGAPEERFADIAVSSFEFEGQALILAVRSARNDSDSQDLFDPSVRGIRRILAA